MSASMMETRDPDAQFRWYDVPPQHARRWRTAFEDDGADLDLTVPCPVCGARALHRFYEPAAHPDRPPLRSGQPGVGLWEWCSSCRSYRCGPAPDAAGGSSDLDVDWCRAGRDPDAIEEARLARVYQDRVVAAADERAILAITPRDKRAARLAAFASALAAAGEVAWAARVAHSIDQPFARSCACFFVATALIRRGQREAARSLVADAEAALPLIGAPWRRALARIADAYASAGAGADVVPT